MENHGLPEAGWNFDNSYVRLPEVFFRRTLPEGVGSPRTVFLNSALAVRLGLDPEVLRSPAAALWLCGNAIPDGGDPAAQAYAGHQYGHPTMLGDGRALLLGEQIAPDGARFDIQWKGTGRTAFSRNGDGRAALGPMLREAVIGEAMHALGIPATRALAVVATGDTVFREDPLPGAVLVRVAASHIRVGTFEFAARLPDPAALRALAAHTLARHFPEIPAPSGDTPAPWADFLRAAVCRQARLVAQWLSAGFVHGVMNTDNMAVSGESIDFGPCAFLDAHDPDAVFSSIDRHGRYAFDRQPSIALWNLTRFAETLLPLLHSDPHRALDTARESLSAFEPAFRTAHRDIHLAKTGFSSPSPEAQELAGELLAWMREFRPDHTNTFLDITRLAGETSPTHPVHPFLSAWIVRWRAVVGASPGGIPAALDLLRRSNPVVIPRNHAVEDALSAAVHGDMAPFDSLLSAVSSPFEQPSDPRLTRPAPPGSPPYRTFCGT